MTDTYPAGFSWARSSAILKQAIPIILGMSSQNILNLVDTIMIGRLGTEELAAVGISGMTIWVVTSLMQGLSPAVQAITARRLGEKQLSQLHVALVNAIYLIVLVGIPATLVLHQLIPHFIPILISDPNVQRVADDYLSIRVLGVVFIGINFAFRGYFNGCKRSYLFMITLLIMHPLNILLNFLLIFGQFGLPRMEAQGAALGTTIATGLGSCFYLFLLFRHREQGFSISPKVFRFHILRKLAHLAIPSCMQTLTMSLGFLLFFKIAETISTEALAATNVLIHLTLTCLLVAIGFGLATITFVGYALGEKRPEEAMNWVKGALWLTCSVLGVVGLVFAATPSFWLNIFINDPQVIAIATVPMILLGLSQLYDAAGIVFSYAHLGGGAMRTVMIISIFNQWLIFLPACYVVIYWLGGNLTHLWICLVSYRFLLFLSFLISIRRGHWLRNAI